MRKITYSMLAGLLVLVACNKSKSGKESAVTEPVDVPVAVKLSSNMSATRITKGEGVLDKWSAQKLYVYGLRRVDGKYVIAADSANPYDQQDENAYLIKNESANAPTSEETTDEGRRGSINVYRVPDTQEFFFYRELYNYDFYAYFVDDAVVETEYLNAGMPQPKESEEDIELRVKIDGTQDILLAKTDRAADVADTGVDASRAYSSYSARRNVTPNLLFEHQLSRFNFKIKAGNQSTDGAVTIQGLRISSVTTGTMVIASNDANYPLGLQPDKDIDLEMLNVRIPENEEERKPRYFEAGAAVPFFGEPVLVMPGQKTYEVELSFSQDGYNVDEGIRRQLLTIDFEDVGYSYKVDENQIVDTVATAGHSYNVTIIVYGLEQVDIEVTLTPWDANHGEFELDPDA